jgi:AcrR family transcriptional regulator
MKGVKAAMTQLDLIDSSSLAAATDTAMTPSKLGRKRDLTRDPEIMDAALDVLAEEGYDGMTIDMVAARAKAGKATVYRRWASKADLVIDSLACIKNSDIDFGNLPDTGTLRGDMIAMIRPHSLADAEKKMRIMAGLVSMLSRNPELAETAFTKMMEPRVKANRIFFQRAIDRGEVAPTVNIDRLASVSSAMAFHRNLMMRKPVDRAFLLSVIDDVILPAAGLPQR